MNNPRLTAVDRFMYSNHTYCRKVEFNLDQIQLIVPFLHVYDANLVSRLPDKSKWRIQYLRDGSCFNHEYDEYTYFTDMIMTYLELELESRIKNIGLNYGGNFSRNYIEKSLNIKLLCHQSNLIGFQTDLERDSFDNLDSDCPEIVTVQSKQGDMLTPTVF